MLRDMSTYKGGCVYQPVFVGWLWTWGRRTWTAQASGDSRQQVAHALAERFGLHAESQVMRLGKGPPPVPEQGVPELPSYGRTQRQA